MLLQHSALYILARGLPGLVSFLAITIYTRLLDPGDYGYYALVIAAVGLLQSVLFRWLELSLLRFLPAHIERPQVIMSVIVMSFLGMISFTSVLALIMFFFLSEPSHRSLLSLAVVLLWAESWYNLNLELLRSQLRPLSYGLMSGLKAVLALVMGSVLILQGLGAYGPLIGLLAGTLMSALLIAGREWKGVQLGRINKQIFIDLLQYGLPLAVTFALTFIVSSSDRFLIAWFLGAESAGLYAPGYDLAFHSIGMLMAIVNLAAYPLVIRSMEQQGEEAARQQFRKNSLLLLAVAVPASIGFAICAPNISNVMLGEGYRETALFLFPWIALAALISGVKSFILDLAFQLGYNTIGQLKVVLVAASVNVILNIWWIPIFGLIGAAYATVISYSVGFILSLVFGRRAFRLPALPLESIKIIIASGIMALVLWLTLGYRGWVALLGQIFLGSGVYVVVLLVLNLAGSRERLLRFLLKTEMT